MFNSSSKKYLLVVASVMAALMILPSATCSGGKKSRYPKKLLDLPSEFFDNKECALDGKTGEFTTEFLVPLDNLVTYPCSKGYLGNLGANDNLLYDLKDAVDEAGEVFEGAMGCGSKCDFYNTELKGAKLDESTFHQKSFLDVLSSRKKYKKRLFYFCNNDPNKGTLGAMNRLWDEKRGAESRGGLNACSCGIFDVNVNGTVVPTEFDWGCTKCIGDVSYKVSQCYDATK